MALILVLVTHSGRATTTKISTLTLVTLVIRATTSMTKTLILATPNMSRVMSLLPVKTRENQVFLSLRRYSAFPGRGRTFATAGGNQIIFDAIPIPTQKIRTYTFSQNVLVCFFHFLMFSIAVWGNSGAIQK